MGQRVRTRLPGRLREILGEASDEDVLILSAGLAFYALVSVVPLTILVLWLTSLVAGDERVTRLAEAVAGVAPRNLGAERALVRVAELGNSLGIASILTGLWPATAYGAGLRRAFHRLSPGRRARKLEGLRGRGLLVLVLLPLLVLGSLAGAVAVTQGLGPVVGAILGLIGAFAVAWICMALIYRVFPPERLTWRQIAGAATWVAIGVAVLSVAFGLAIALGADFERHYAISGLAGIVLVAVWLFGLNLLLLLGYRGARAT
jgi:membrane protein